MKLFKDLYQYRELLKTNVLKDIRGKYKGSILGVLWTFFNPLLQVIVYAIVFPYIMRIKTENYLIYLIIGIIPWNFFLQTITLGMITILSNAGIIKKVYFPREILPISEALSGLINFMISSLIIFIFCFFSVGISWHVILFPIIALIQFILCLGIIFALSAINVYLKDAQYIIQFCLNLLFYATPILYTPELFPEEIRCILYMNPITQLVMAYRDIFMYHTLPSIEGVIYVLLFAIVVVIIGYKIFKKLEKGFAEEL